MTEQEVTDALALTASAVEEAKANLLKTKWAVIDAETRLIEAKITHDRAKEALRVYKNTTPKHIMERRDLEIEKFRDDHKELVEWARNRDQDK